MTLTEFLEARIAEDEAGARAAVSGLTGRWEVSHDPEGEYLEVVGQFPRDFTPPAPNEVPGGVTSAGGHWWQVTSWEYDGWGDASKLPEEIAAHIARHDPARVLAECEAKRRIVEWHKPLKSPAGFAPNCEGCWEDGGEDGAPLWPCRNVRWLAVIWQDHPDYREEWRAS